MSLVMSDDGEKTTVSCLTPPRRGAIATLAIVGPRGWPAVRQLFHGSCPLPQTPATGRVWHGWLGDRIRDQVTIWANPQHPENWIEVHCHGGSEVVRQLMLDFERLGIDQRPCPEQSGRQAPSPLRTSAQLAIPSALTLRTRTSCSGSEGARERPAGNPGSSRHERNIALQAPSRLTRHGLGHRPARPWRVVIAGR